MGSGRTRCEGLDHSAQAIAECSRVPRRSFGPHREFAQCSRIGIAVATNLLSPLAPRRSIGLRGARSDAFIFGIVWFTRSGLNQACAYDVLVFFRILSGLLVHRRLHMRVSPHKAGTYWPSPSSPSAQRVLLKVRQISDLLVWNASDESAQIVIQWSWQQLDDELTGHLSLAWAASILVSSVFPVEGPVRRRPESLHCMAVLLVTLSIARLRRAMQSRHPRRWACRVLRALPPGWLGSVAQPGHPLRQALVDVIAGRYPTVSSCMGAAGGVSLVYCLFSETGWYWEKRTFAGSPRSFVFNAAFNRECGSIFVVSSGLNPPKGDGDDTNLCEGLWRQSAGSHASYARASPWRTRWRQPLSAWRRRRVTHWTSSIWDRSRRVLCINPVFDHGLLLGVAYVHDHGIACGLVSSRGLHYVPKTTENFQSSWVLTPRTTASRACTVGIRLIDSNGFERKVRFGSGM